MFNRKILVTLKFKYKLQKYNKLYFKLKVKIQGFMLCLKGKIHRKILVTLKFQDDVRAKIKMYKILYVKR
jgi:hypothetical protein